MLDKFSFEVRPHGTRPFCITVLIDSIRDLRVSTCCEYKHKKGLKISHFTLVDVIGGKMCANCKKGLNSPKIPSIPTSAVTPIQQKVSQNNEQNNEIESKFIEVKSDSDVEECEQTVIEATKQSSRTSSIAEADYNQEHFETYDSEFETETPDSVRVRTNSVSSDENSDGNGRKEVVEAQIHTYDDPDDVI